MELKIEYLNKTQLKPYINNAKLHPTEQIEQIKRSIEEFGFNDPIAIWHDNEIIEGHGRLLAVMDMDDIERVPVIRLDDLTDEERRAYMLVHNKLTINSGFDFELLDIELENIDIDMSEFGFDMPADEEPQEIIEDQVPEEVKTRCKLGDLWQLGDHRLLCGDSTDANTVKMLMDGQKAKMLFTSPPYSDMREYNGNKDLSVDNLIRFISTYRPYTDYQCVNLGIQRKEHEIVQYWDSYIAEAKNAGYKLLAWNVWDKMACGSIGQQSAFFPIRHEWIFVFGTKFFEINGTWVKAEASINRKEKKRKVRQPDGSMRYSTIGDTSNKLKQMESVVAVHSENSNIRKLHPATFPVGLPAEYIKAMADKNDIVIDPFGGSGSTLIACEQLNKKCYMCELDEHYCDVIIQRWEDFTGQKAVKLNAS